MEQAVSGDERTLWERGRGRAMASAAVFGALLVPCLFFVLFQVAELAHHVGHGVRDRTLTSLGWLFYWDGALWMVPQVAALGVLLFAFLSQRQRDASVVTALSTACCLGLVPLLFLVLHFTDFHLLMQDPDYPYAVVMVPAMGALAAAVVCGLLYARCPRGRWIALFFILPAAFLVAMTPIWRSRVEGFELPATTPLNLLHLAFFCAPAIAALPLWLGCKKWGVPPDGRTVLLLVGLGFLAVGAMGFFSALMPWHFLCFFRPVPVNQRLLAALNAPFVLADVLLVVLIWRRDGALRRRGPAA